MALRCIVELLGSPFGAPDLRTNIQRVTLPAFQRRPLVLAASSLVMNAFADPDRPVHGIEVELSTLERGTVRLRVIVVGSVWADPRRNDNLEDPRLPYG